VIKKSLRTVGLNKNYENIYEFFKGSVYFTSDNLVATDRLELLCRQSKIWSHGMTQHKEKGHFVKKTLSCSWYNG